MHNAVSSAPNINRILEESHNTPFTRRISNAIISDPGSPKVRILQWNLRPERTFEVIHNFCGPSQIQTRRKRRRSLSSVRRTLERTSPGLVIKTQGKFRGQFSGAIDALSRAIYGVNRSLHVRRRSVVIVSTAK